MTTEPTKLAPLGNLILSLIQLEQTPPEDQDANWLKLERAVLEVLNLQYVQVPKPVFDHIFQRP